MSRYRHPFPCAYLWLRCATTPVALTLGACAHQSPPPASDGAHLGRQARTEVSRICDLPQDERAVQLQKLQQDAGVVLYCGKTD
jgi:hypothetical protein